jgi:agmatinase
MSEPRYEANLPSVGLVSMFRSPICEDFSKLDAEIAFLGIPYDGGIGFRPGTHRPPEAFRRRGVRFVNGHIILGGI